MLDCEAMDKRLSKGSGDVPRNSSFFCFCMHIQEAQIDYDNDKNKQVKGFRVLLVYVKELWL